MTPRRLRAPLLLAVVWLAGAAVATSIGVLAVQRVASQVGDPAVPALSAQAVADATTSPAAGPATPTPAGSRSPAPAAATTSGTFRSAGGTVGMQCAGTTARLLYATPADGYALDEQEATGSELEVRFEAGQTRVRLDLSCSTGAPRLVDERVDTDEEEDRQDD